MASVQEALELIRRGCDELIVEDELARKLAQGRALRVKLGLDPTAPDLQRTYKRLRPDWLGHWLAKPRRILPIAPVNSTIGPAKRLPRMRPMGIASTAASRSE